MQLKGGKLILKNTLLFVFFIVKILTFSKNFTEFSNFPTFAIPDLKDREMVGIAQLVRAPDCGSGGRGFEPHYLPKKRKPFAMQRVFIFNYSV